MGKMKNILEKVLQKPVFKRRCFCFLFDTFLISGSKYVSFWCRFNGEIPGQYQGSNPAERVQGSGEGNVFFIINKGTNESIK